MNEKLTNPDGHARQDPRPPLRRQQRESLPHPQLHYSKKRSHFVNRLRRVEVAQRKHPRDAGEHSLTRLQIELGTACGKLYRCSVMVCIPVMCMGT